MSRINETPAAFLSAIDGLSDDICDRELGERIAHEVQCAHGKTCEGLGHIRRAGELLMVAKESCGRGGFMVWVKKHCKFSHSKACQYMRVAARWDELLATGKVETVATLTLRAAIDLLAEPGVDKPADETQRDFGDDTKAPEEFRVKKRGRGIGPRLGVRCWCPKCDHQWHGNPMAGGRIKCQRGAATANVDARLTEDDYRFVFECLRPDRAPEGRTGRFAKALGIINRLQSRVAEESAA